MNQNENFTVIIPSAITLMVLGFVSSLVVGMTKMVGGSSSSPKQLSQGSENSSHYTIEELLRETFSDTLFLAEQMEKRAKELKELSESLEMARGMYKSNPHEARRMVIQEINPEIAGLGGYISHWGDVVSKMSSNIREVVARGI